MKKDGMAGVKCVVWDLDDTLWDGACLEDPGVTLKPGIREVLTGLRDRGILLSIASKNEPVALRFVDQFGLRDLFLHPQVNWDSKDENIRRIAERLDIDLDTIAFVDDSAFEREGVAATLPGVRTYDSVRYLELLELEEMQLRYDTVEARQRSDMYVAEGRRQEVAQEFEGRREDFLRSLEMVAVGRTAQRDDLPRIAELMARTNQFNSTGLRYSEAQVEAAWNDEAQQFCVISQRDRLGDNGRCGVALTRREGGTLHIEALMLSCRVAGRGLGTAFLCYLTQRAIYLSCNWMSARYVRTERNRQVGLLYKILGFVRDDEHSDETSSVFIYDLRKGPTALPDWLQLVSPETARHG